MPARFAWPRLAALIGPVSWPFDAGAGWPFSDELALLLFFCRGDSAFFSLLVGKVEMLFAGLITPLSPDNPQRCRTSAKALASEGGISAVRAAHCGPPDVSVSVESLS